MRARFRVRVVRLRKVSVFVALCESLRRTAFTKGAAERLRARFTSSTLSWRAARCGTRSSQQELIEGQAKGDENFEVEFREWLRGGGGDFVVEARTPAEDAHHEFGGQGVIGSGETLVGGGVQKFGGVGGVALDAEEDVEGGGAGGGDGHCFDCRLSTEERASPQRTQRTQS